MRDGAVPTTHVVWTDKMHIIMYVPVEEKAFVEVWCGFEKN